MGTWGVLTNIYFKGLFFIYRSSLSGLHFYTSGESQAGGGGGVKANLIIFCQGGGVQNKFEQKGRGARLFFLVRWEGKAGRG